MNEEKTMPEWPQNISFCPDLGAITTSDLSHRIATTLFGCADNSGFETLLKRRYAQMCDHIPANVRDGEAWNLGGEYLDCVNNGHGRNHDAALQVPKSRLQSANAEVRELLTRCNFGHDLPVWVMPINGADQTRRVMIIGQDPLRDGDDRGFVTLGTPFGLHSINCRRGHGAVLANVVGRLCNNGCSVYLTDYCKFYACRKGFVQENLPALYYGFDAFIRSEIEAFNPSVIVTLGESTLSLLDPDWRSRSNPPLADSVKFSAVVYHHPCRGEYDGKPILGFPHPSGSNTHWPEGMRRNEEKIQYIFSEIASHLNLN